MRTGLSTLFTSFITSGGGSRGQGNRGAQSGGRRRLSFSSFATRGPASQSGRRTEGLDEVVDAHRVRHHVERVILPQIGMSAVRIAACG